MCANYAHTQQLIMLIIYFQFLINTCKIILRYKMNFRSNSDKLMH